MLRRRRRVGARARARIRAGGPSSIHRPALPRAAYRALVAHCLAREGGRCWWCRSLACWPLDPAHVIARSQGGADSVDNVVILGRPCHRRQEAPYATGRLVIRSLGSERFVGELVVAKDKWEARARGSTQGG